MLSFAVTRFAARVDDFVYQAALSRGERSRKASPAESLGHAERIRALQAIGDAYAHRAEAQLFPAPRPATPTVTVTPVRHFGRGGEVFELAWTSEFAPLLPELEHRYARLRANRRARARVYGVPGAGRPAVLVVHGYLGGQVAFEERFWPLRALLRRGLDVALVVLPGHGARRDSPRTRPFFPGSDPRLTVEGFRQSILDVRALSAILRARGAPRVGVMGMSLGGYVAALLATVDPTLSFAVPVVPLASIADFARDGNRLVGTADERLAQHRALERAHAAVSPLARPARIDPARIAVVAGEVDRITPQAHAEKLARHLGAHSLVFPGAHLVQTGRDPVLERALDLVGA